jgi:hypothetical protein
MNSRSLPGGPPVGGQESRRDSAGADFGYGYVLVKGCRSRSPYSRRCCCQRGG